MDDHLDRFFRRLVSNLAALDPASLETAFPVQDIAERLVPYRTHRAALGFDTSEDYELCLLRLLAGERGLGWVTPDDVREALAREVGSVNPDPGLYRQFPDARILLDPDQVAAALGDLTTAAEAGPRPAPPPRRDPPPEPLHFAPTPPPEPAFEAIEPEDVTPDETAEAEALPFTLDDDDGAPAPGVTTPRTLGAGAACGYCGGALPIGRTVLFCPHCGQNVGMVHCPTCGTEMDVGWRFCISCGQKVTGLG